MYFLVIVTVSIIFRRWIAFLFQFHYSVEDILTLLKWLFSCRLKFYLGLLVVSNSFIWSPPFWISFLESCTKSWWKCVFNQCKTIFHCSFKHSTLDRVYKHSLVFVYQLAFHKNLFSTIKEFDKFIDMLKSSIQMYEDFYFFLNARH